MSDSTLTRSGFAEASIAAAKVWLSVEFAKYTEKPLTIFLAKSVDEFRQYGRVDVNDGDKSSLQSPFAVMSIGSIGLDTEIAGLKKNRVNNGIQTNVDRENGISYHEDMRPAIIGAGLAFVSDSMDDVFLFAETLLYSAPTITLSLANEHGFIANCSLLIDPELTIPPPDSDIGGIFRFETSLRIRTYIGHSKQMRLIKKLKVSVVDTAFATDLKNVVYDGEADPILRESFNYQDLFDKNSHVYKYNHKDL